MFGTPDTGGRTLVLAVLAQDERGQLGAVAMRVDERYPALTPGLPRGAPVRARDCRSSAGSCPKATPGSSRSGGTPPTTAPPSAPGRSVRSGALFLLPSSKARKCTRWRSDRCTPASSSPDTSGSSPTGKRCCSWRSCWATSTAGVERLLETRAWPDAVLVAESIAGDTVIGHASAACGAIEALARSRKSPRAQAIRGIALELERLANHIGDLGAIAGDIAYLPAASYFGRMRGECLNLLMTLSGNRYGRGLVRPGGALFDIPPAMAAEMRSRLRACCPPSWSRSATCCSRTPRCRRASKASAWSHARPACDLGLVGVPRGPVRSRATCATTTPTGCSASPTSRWPPPGPAMSGPHAGALAGDPAVAGVRRRPGRRPARRRSPGGLRRASARRARGRPWRRAGGERSPTSSSPMTAGSVRRHKVVDPSFHNWRPWPRRCPATRSRIFRCATRASTSPTRGTISDARLPPVPGWTPGDAHLAVPRWGVRVPRAVPRPARCSIRRAATAAARDAGSACQRRAGASGRTAGHRSTSGPVSTRPEEASRCRLGAVSLFHRLSPGGAATGRPGERDR